MKLRQVLTLFCITMVLVFFQNCAPPSHTPTTDQASNIVDDDDDDTTGLNYSEDELAESFSKTLQPVLSNYCSACHGVSQIPLFAVSDALEASKTIFQYNLVNLKDPAESRFVAKINGGHNGFPKDWADEIQSAIADWEADLKVNAQPVVKDTEDPIVILTSPSSAMMVSGTIAVTGLAGDNVGVASVQIFINDEAFGVADTSEPYSIPFNSAALTNGAYTLKLVALDAAGNRSESVAVNITVNNVVSDTTQPTVSVTSPTEGLSVSGTINLTANATDDFGVAGVQFYVDGIAFGAEDTSSPYSVSLSTTALTNASHTITVRARDAAGNMRTSAGVTVTVSNPTTNPNATFTWINTNVLIPRCLACHGSNGDGGVSLNSYTNVMKIVRVNNANNSKLYTETNSGSMPEGSSKLSVTQLNAIRDWINTGALNN